ncbi:hypothetical protein HZS61_013714 [Fusarium oxysporum f. sp. conglutinans]|uniref:Uncharacterized protein n=1 Tax=Fusarium oxysporum f. sp. conglutinans TaxID=100902 RepID=A0A8H6GRB6_FUSOX|nr:hypothetical protein HZS61_013714 [Fusarium oxysporum f. sp. conglutinans]KAI8413551.1 hypothetical protein FOFC_06832 [Fusarium oxysporum]
MPGKASDWDNADFLLDLVVGLYTGAQVNGGLTPPVKQSIEEYIKGRGYTASFDAVRAEDWSNVMGDLQQKGYTFTEGALRYDF